MILLFPAALIGLGIMSLLNRGTLLGVLIGLQLCTIGASLLFSQLGTMNGAPVSGQIFSLLILLSSVAQLVAGYAFGSRLFFLNRRARMQDVQALKR